MSRDYAITSSRYWTGETGKMLRSLGRDFQVVGFYLFTCPNSNMLGLYYLPIPTLCHEVGHIDKEGASKVLRRLSEGGYAHYDEHSEHVFVPEMARHQVGERLAKKDNRHKALVKLLEQYRKIRFFNDFLDRYLDAFELDDVIPNKPLPSPFGAPSKPGSGSGSGSDAGSGTRSGVTREGLNGHSQDERMERMQGFRAIYPKGVYRESEWLPAEREIGLREDEGDTFEAIYAGCERYRAQCDAKGSTGTQYVMSPAKFVRERLYHEPFPLPATKAESRRDANVDASLTWLADQEAKDAIGRS